MIARLASVSWVSHSSIGTGTFTNGKLYNFVLLSNVYHYLYLLRAVGFWIGQIADRMHMKHGKLKLEVSSYTLKLIPHGGALINGRKCTFIKIPSLISPLRGSSRCSRPSTTTTLGRGTKAAWVSQPIGCFPDTAER